MILKSSVRVIESIGAGYGYIKHQYPITMTTVGCYYVFSTKFVHRGQLPFLK